MERAPVVLVVAGDPERLRERYGDRSERFELLEAGHVGQNIALTAHALGLGVVTIGSFGDGDVADVLDLPEGEHVHYLLPVGHPRPPPRRVRAARVRAARGCPAPGSVPVGWRGDGVGWRIGA